MLQFCGVNTNLSTRSGFFLHPWKHFPYGDTYGADRAACTVEAQHAEKEDDPSPNGGGAHTALKHTRLPQTYYKPSLVCVQMTQT